MSSEDQKAIAGWERAKRVRMAGGMSEAECEELRRLHRERLAESLANPQRVLTDVSVTTWGGLMVTGCKPE